MTTLLQPCLEINKRKLLKLVLNLISRGNDLDQPDRLPFAKFRQDSVFNILEIYVFRTFSFKFDQKIKESSLNVS